LSKRHAPAGSTPDASSERQRLDKWLVYARFAKTRSVAVELVEDGRVRLNGDRTTNPTRLVGPGDVLTLALPHATKLVRVVSAAERRGSFPDAQLLYEEL
jgi:ribosome-associated heat shock protein Hsp15